MQKIMTFFRTLLKSATSPAYYADVYRTRFGFSLKYFVMFNALTALVILAKLLVPLSVLDVQGIANKAVSAFPADLVVNVSNGRLTINKPLPYVIPIPQDWSEERQTSLDKNLVVFESDKNMKGLSDFFDYNTVVLVTERAIFVQSDEDRGEVKAYEVPQDAEPFTISSKMFYELKDAFLNMPVVKNKWYVPLIGVLLLIILIPTLTWFRFLTVLIYSVITYLAALMLSSSLLKNRRFEFSKVLQIGLHTMTVTLLVAFVVKLLTSADTVHGWWFFIVYFVVTMVALSGAAQHLGTRVAATPVKTVTATSKSKKTNKKK